MAGPGGGRRAVPHGAGLPLAVWAVQMRAEIKRAASDLEALLESVPAGISLGLVHVNISKTRELLVKKQEKLVALLKGLAARVPRRAMAAVSSKFSELNKQLLAKANSVEDVDEQRKFIESLPVKVRGRAGGRGRAWRGVPACVRPWQL